MDMKVTAALTFMLVQFANLPTECAISQPYLSSFYGSFGYFLSTLGTLTYVGLLIGLGMFIAISIYLFLRSALNANPLKASLPSICLGLVVLGVVTPLALSTNVSFFFPLGACFPVIGYGLILTGLVFLLAGPLSMNTKLVKTVTVTFMVVQLANLLIESWLMLQHPLVFS